MAMGARTVRSDKEWDHSGGFIESSLSKLLEIDLMGLKQNNKMNPVDSRVRTQLMTPEQCASFLQIEVNTLYVMKSQRRIPYRKVGHLLRFDFEEIVEWTLAKGK
jgi:excisionase family DNA binding protein